MRKQFVINLFSNVLLLAASQSVSAQTLQNRWSFNAPAGGTTVTDSVSSVVATLEGNASLDGAKVNLDGTSGTYVELGSGLLTGISALTCEGWVATNGVSPDNVHLFEFSDGNGTGNAYYRYNLHEKSNGDNFTEISDGWIKMSSAPGLGGVGGLHVVTVYDPVAGMEAIYTNGILEVMQTGTLSPLSAVSTAEASLGQSPWSAYGDPYLNGSISEFRIWNGPLDPLQVAALDTAGSTAVSTDYGTVTSVQLDLNYQIEQHAVQQAVVLATASALKVQPNIASLCAFNSGNTNILTVSASGSITAVAPGSTTITASYGVLGSTQTVTVVPPVAVLRNRWSFDAPAGGTTVTDSVSRVVATLEGNASLDGTKVNLDGTSGTYVELGSGLLTGISALTCEGWVATNAVSPDNVHLFEFSDGSGTGNAYYRYNLHASGNSDNFTEISDGWIKMSSAPGFGGVGGLHVVTIYDPVAQAEAIFTNGALEVVQTGVLSPLSAVSTNEASLGQSPWSADGDPYLNGSISEFRIYSDELSPQQIAMDYLAGPASLLTNGPGALKSIALNLAPTMNAGVSATPALLATYANLTNFNLTANSIFPVAGLVVTSSATNVISVGLNNVLTAINTGTTTITATYQGFSSQTTVTVIQPPLKYKWSAPVAFNGLNADQILTNVPGAIVGAAVFGGTPQTVTLSSGQVIDFTIDGSVATTTGNGAFDGAYGAYAGTTNTTGNADFDLVLNEASDDGGPKTIVLTNLTAGGYYSVQLFGLDDRNGGEGSRQANFQDPNYIVDVSQTFTMGTNVYVVGTFWSTNTSARIQMNLLSSGSGNLNALVVRQLPTVAIQNVGGNVQITWSVGTLLQAPALTGPWTTNVNTSPYTFTPTAPNMFYRVQLP
jgi:hypothetical protein